MHTIQNFLTASKKSAPSVYSVQYLLTLTATSHSGASVLCSTAGNGHTRGLPHNQSVQSRFANNSAFFKMNLIELMTTLFEDEPYRR